MIPGHYADPAENYEAAAEHFACHFRTFHPHGRAFEIDLQILEGLCTGIYPETLEFISADPVAFADRVAQYRYGMES